MSTEEYYFCWIWPQKPCVSFPFHIKSIIRSIVKVLFIQPFSLHFYIHIAYVYSHHSKNRKCNQIYFKRNSKLHIVFANSYYLFIIDRVKDHQKEGWSNSIFINDGLSRWFFFHHFTKFESFRNSITFFWGQLVIIAKYFSLCCLPTYFPKDLSSLRLLKVAFLPVEKTFYWPSIPSRGQQKVKRTEPACFSSQLPIL